VRPGAADGDRSLRGHVPADEQGQSGDEHLLGPRQGEAALHQQLPAVRGHYLSPPALQLDPRQGVAGAVAGGGTSGLGQRRQEVRFERLEACRRLRQRGHLFGRHEVERPDAGDAAVVPASLALAVADGRQRDGAVFALNVNQ
jgi:hypothetical protein